MNKIIEHSYTWNGRLTYGNRPVKAVLHHSYSKDGTVESFHRGHIRDNGWIGIGYQFVVYKNGEIHRGRPESAIGSHCKGQNSNSIGICAVGNYDKNTPMPEAQKAAIVWLIKDYLRPKYSATMAITKHKDHYNTACPGKYFPFAEIVGRVESKTTSNIRTMYKGLKGEDVRRLQEKLIELGYNLGKYGADGSFGNDTDTAVKYFQKHNGLDVDGKVGPNTRGKLEEILALPVKTVNTKSDPLNLRAKAVDGAVVAMIPKGAKVRIISSSNGWSYVIYGTLRGYASSAYLA